MTRAGYVLGTPYYMAPEQVTGQNITEQVDVYAFGVMLFELMTGAKPISGDTVERIFYSILNEPLNLEPLYKAGAPQPLCDLVARCTAKGPADRPQGFAPVCAELDRLIAAAELHAAPTIAVAPPAPLATAQAPAVRAPEPPAPGPAPSATISKPARPAWIIPAAVGGGLSSSPRESISPPGLAPPLQPQQHRRRRRRGSRRSPQLSPLPPATWSSYPPATSNSGRRRPRFPFPPSTSTRPRSRTRHTPSFAAPLAARFPRGSPR